MLIAADGLEADVALYDLLVLSILCESAKKKFPRRERYPFRNIPRKHSCAGSDR
jgi:hypothetical protein